MCVCVTGGGICVCVCVCIWLARCVCMCMWAGGSVVVVVVVRLFVFPISTSNGLLTCLSIREISVGHSVHGSITSFARACAGGVFGARIFPRKYPHTVRAAS